MLKILYVLLNKNLKSCPRNLKNRGGLEKYGVDYNLRTLKILFKWLIVSTILLTAQEIALFCRKWSQLQKHLL